MELHKKDWDSTHQNHGFKRENWDATFKDVGGCKTQEKLHQRNTTERRRKGEGTAQNREIAYPILELRQQVGLFLD